VTDSAARAERLLILAPTGRDAELASAALGARGLACEVARDIASLCAALEEGAGAVLLAEEVLAPAAAQRLAAWVLRQPPWSDLPILVVTSMGGALDVRGEALDRLAPLGNVTLLERPLRRMTLVSAARSALRARARQYAARELLRDREHAVAARDQFLAMLGHELRNPLAAISLALAVRDEPSAKHVEIIRRQTRQLARLVDDLLDVSRVTSGKIVLRRAPLDVGAVVRRAVEALEARAGAAGVALALDDACEPLPAEGDAARLEQVLANLLGNALKYTPAGGHVYASAAREGDAAVVRVRDDGIGIAPHDLAHVFEPFVQVTAALDRAQGGLGLGLTLAQSLVAMHGGTLEAASAGLGRGTEFTIRLPLAGAAADRNRGADGSRAPRGRSVLVVDDSEDYRNLLRGYLEERGHRVAVSRDGPGGVAAALGAEHDAVLVDIGLPGYDGYEVARRIRAARGGEVLLVAVTGYGQRGDRERARLAGFDHHLTKPLDLARLDTILDRGRAAGGVA
jgi:signal transduction histidine kinase/CheY-like chemotaxis protein